MVAVGRIDSLQHHLSSAASVEQACPRIHPYSSGCSLMHSATVRAPQRPHSPLLTVPPKSSRALGIYASFCVEDCVN